MKKHRGPEPASNPVCSVSPAEYAGRRQALMDKLPLGSVALLAGSRERVRNSDGHYPFRQNSYCYYLSGFSEPNAFLVLIKEEQAHRFILFCEPYCAKTALWDGPRVGIEGACVQFGADEAYAVQDFDQRLLELIADAKQIFYGLGQEADWDQKIIALLSQKAGSSRAHGLALLDLCPHLNELRLIKSPAEIALMTRAAAISVAAHQTLMRAAEPNLWEYQLEALFAYHSTIAGARALAYGSIVAGAARACTLHYVQNDQMLKDGDLVLIDAGAEYQNYAADITRTFPVNGRFTADQRALYEVVLAAQLAAIALIRPGTPWNVLQETVVAHLVEGLLHLGILKGKAEALIAEKAYRKFYMHGSGHWLGLDVHDAGSYQVAGKPRSLEAGMVLTVEPGLYIPVGDPSVPERWWGMGIRIEDDVLVCDQGVCDQGHRVLSQELPKSVEAIEALMASKHTVSVNVPCSEANLLEGMTPKTAHADIIATPLQGEY